MLNSPSGECRCILLFEGASSTESAGCHYKPEENAQAQKHWKKSQALHLQVYNQLFMDWEFLILIAPDLDLVRCRVVILQEVVHFGLQPIQILFFYFQGTHQFLLYKKRWIITGDTGKTSGCSKREVLWLRSKWMTNYSCQNPIYHRWLLPYEMQINYIKDISAI